MWWGGPDRPDPAICESVWNKKGSSGREMFGGGRAGQGRVQPSRLACLVSMGVSLCADCELGASSPKRYLYSGVAGVQ